MRTLKPADSLNLPQEPRDFSFILGGPLFQLLRQSHLTDDALGLLSQRIIVISLLAWLPLLVLSALEGKVLGGAQPSLPARLRSSPPLPSGVTPLDCSRACCASAHAFRDQAIPCAAFDSESAMTRFDAATASVSPAKFCLDRDGPASGLFLTGP
jgi:hypothetical protein